ncbi:MAG TPA: glycosyltransferase [Vicinamibacterales bacterium]|nr:glycosyltransferase [Vicinamibacterales bacterium]
MSTPELSVVLVAGSQRTRAQRVLDALAAQTVAAGIEVVVVDVSRPSLPPLDTSRLRTTYVRRPDIDRWAAARVEGVRAASAATVAFIEDHCFPARTWAEILIETHRDPWVAVGYAFTNANPQTYVSRSSMLARYGGFAHPCHGGPSRFLSGNNVSYKRQVLLDFGAALEGLLAIDFNLQELLGQRGVAMFVESRALAAHQNFTSVIKEGRAGHAYCRLLAARRAESQSWGAARRVVYGLAAPVGAPIIRVARLLSGLPGRRPLWWTVAAGLPVIVIEYLFDASGESLGYLFGVGNAERETMRWELETDRTGTN